MNVLSTASKCTQKTRNFIVQFEGNSCVEKWAKSSLDDLRDWILKEQKKLLKEQCEEQAQRRAQRSGGLHGASKLYDKVLTPQQMDSLDEYMNKFITAMNYFQRWVRMI